MVHTLKPGPIVLLTDFGLSDAFVGVMKGVIKNINPKAGIIDLSHGISPQDVTQASLYLSTSFHYFPKGSVFCVVVDPGVGSDRNAICIQTDDYWFVGPDNGVLWQAATEDGIRNIAALSNPEFFLDPVSNTFHGRDIFAPVSAHLTTGKISLDQFGSLIPSCMTLAIPKPVETDLGLTLTVLYIDHFGNIGLNLSASDFHSTIGKRSFTLNYGSATIKDLYHHYNEAPSNQLFLITASNGFMEISLKNGHAAEQLQIQTSDKLQLNFRD